MSASVFCRAEWAFLCVGCNSKVHAANKLASRHAQVWVCEVCEQAPTSITSKVDAAALYVACDRDIYSVNPLARRHNRVSLIAFYDFATAAKCSGTTTDDMKCILDEKPHINAQYHHHHQQQHHHHNSHGVVPVLGTNDHSHLQGPIVDGYSTYDMDYAAGSKLFMYNFSSQSIIQSIWENGQNDPNV
ncbi:hypothetical protein M9H77_23105 [Catharanthus roseus]|uniref:Uncharacterized protein n=1 Tax=Catharanthus roseus TaxID=4058 RepID=A0ACC0AUX0_CATRO|nr:hypothetical protein M9H77_23105 [Catharanthus roseus]